MQTRIYRHVYTDTYIQTHTRAGRYEWNSKMEMETDKRPEDKSRNSGVARQLCARGRAMKLAPPAPSLFFKISKFSFEILEFKF